MTKPYVSDVVDYVKDVQPYGFIQINAGVGSGKSTFVNDLITGYTAKNEDGTIKYTVPPQKVLLITSRRAKVDEILSNKNVSIGAYVMEWDHGCPVEDLDEYLESEKTLPDLDETGNPVVHQRSIACTNAAIEKYLRKNYLPSDASTHLWRRFDFIVIDEVHSVLADASYQSAPFYVHRLVNRTYKAFREEGSSCKVVIMTGTPHILDSFKLPKQGHLIDLMDKCRNVVPQAISFVDVVETKKSLQRRLARGERVIYFANHIKSLFKVYEELRPELQVATAFSFSNTERLDITDPPQRALYDRMKDTEKAIAEEQALPDDIKLLLTTSKNKEGINIWNKDIKALYVESHNEVDIIQMAGRVRNGVECLYIVTDSSGFGKTESVWEYRFSANAIPIDAVELSQEGGIKNLNLVEYINHYFEQLCSKCKINLAEEWRKPTCSYEPARAFIDFIHTKFPYMLYDYFTDKFSLYIDRKSSVNYFDNQSKKYAEALGDKARLEALAKSWFGDICVVWPESVQAQLDRYFERSGMLNVPYDEEQRKRIKADVEQIFGKTTGQFKKALREYGYDEKSCSKNKNALTYGHKKIVKLQ